MSHAWSCDRALAPVPIRIRALQGKMLANTAAEPGDCAGWDGGRETGKREVH